MPITTAVCTSYKSEKPQGIHAAADVYKLLLIKVGAIGTYGAATTNVGTPGGGTPNAENVGTDEAAGSGYVSGGITLAAPSFTISGTTAMMDFASPTPFIATLSAIGAVIYNSSKGNRVLACFDFGGTVSSTGALYTITLPTPGVSTSLLREA